MAGEDIYGGLSQNDLINFNNQVVQSDPYGIAGAGLNAWQPNYTTFSPVESGVTAFTKSFLSGLLGNYAQKRASDQLASVIQSLPQLTSNPINAPIPEGVSEGPYNILKGTVAVNQERAKGLELEMQKKFNSDLLFKLLGKKAEIIGESQGYDALGGGGSVNPNSPQYKANKDKTDTLDTLRDKFNKLPEVTAFSQVQRAASAMAGALADKGSQSDLELVRYAIQMIEPGLSVREGEQQAVLKSQSIPEQWKGELSKTLENGTGIGTTAREGLKRLATRAYEAQKFSYDKALTYYQGLAEGRQLLTPGESISYIGKAPDAASVFGASKNIDARTFAQQALARGLSKEQARAEWNTLQAKGN